MRWKIATVLLLLSTALCGWYLIQAGIKQRASDKIIDAYAAEELKRQKYVPGEYEKPVIKDAPSGTKPILKASGTVRYPAKPAAPTSTVAVSPNGDTVDVPGFHVETPCSLDDLDLTLNCRVDVLGTPTRPWAKLVQSATVTAWGQTREFPEMPAGDVQLQVTPAVVPPTWHMNFLGGASIGERTGLEAGVQWSGKSRFGFYTMVEYQFANSSTVYASYNESYFSTGDPSTWRLHAGLSFRIR